MKVILSFLLMLIFASCANAKERIYTGSTPAGPIIKSFLEIPFADSVDFIRWKIIIRDDKYTLQCNYGISKPNTNGFINGGKKIELKGSLEKENNYYYFLYNNKMLRVVELNKSLLHLLNDDKSLLAGNGGWSYTLNLQPGLLIEQVNINPGQNILKDSMAFEGRTPCTGVADVHPGTVCYKLKWYVVLYADPETHKPTTYHMNGTAYRRSGSKAGTWEAITGKNNRTIYKLNGDKEDSSLYLLKLDENILVFTDEQGKLLVGDEDFSYTLNRRW